MEKLILFTALILLLTGCRESLEERAAREAKTYTEKTCPYKMDEFTTLDSVTFDTATHTFHNYYTLTGTADREISETEYQNMRTLLLQQLQNDTKQKVYKEAGYSYNYVYRSKSNPKTVLFEVTYNNKDYQ